MRIANIGPRWTDRQGYHYMPFPSFFEWRGHKNCGSGSHHKIGQIELSAKDRLPWNKTNIHHTVHGEISWKSDKTCTSSLCHKLGQKKQLTNWPIMVNVLKFQTLYAIFFQFKFHFYSFISQNTWWKGKQCRPWPGAVCRDTTTTALFSE